MGAPVTPPCLYCSTNSGNGTVLNGVNPDCSESVVSQLTLQVMSYTLYSLLSVIHCQSPVSYLLCLHVDAWTPMHGLGEESLMQTQGKFCQ